MMNNNRVRRLVERFFEIMEEGGEYVEIFLIRDLLMEEYIAGRERQLTVAMIEDIIESNIMPDIYENLNKAFDYEINIVEIVVEEAYESMWSGEIDKAFDLVNEYGMFEYSNPYVYYSLVRELERITGETLIELCL